MKVAIVGGGISGLATAFHVQRLSPETEVSLFEKEDYLGGTMHTVDVDDFLFEAGPNGFLSNKPDTLDLVKQVGADELLLKSDDSARVRFIFTDGLHRLPESPKAFLKTKLLSFTDKLRVLSEVFIAGKAQQTDESLQTFGYRRVGKAFTDIFLDAMAAGIHASTPDTLSVNAAFPAVVRLEREYGGLFRGMLKGRKRSTGPGGVLMSFRGGMSTFVDHLAKRLNARIYRGTRITGVESVSDGYAISTAADRFVVDKVLLATPAYVGAELLRDLDPQLSRRLGAVEYSPIAVVGFGYEQLPRSLDGFGLLTTTSAAQQILGVLWDSSIFFDRAPVGKACLRVLIGGQRNPELIQQTDEGLIQLALLGIKKTMDVETRPAVTFIKRWHRGIPHYRVGHPAAVRDIFQRLERHPGLYLNSNAYFGIGINDCVASSKRCAERILQDRG